MSFQQGKPTGFHWDELTYRTKQLQTAPQPALQVYVQLQRGLRRSCNNCLTAKVFNLVQSKNRLAGRDGDCVKNLYKKKDDLQQQEGLESHRETKNLPREPLTKSQSWRSLCKDMDFWLNIRMDACEKCLQRWQISTHWSLQGALKTPELTQTWQLALTS